MTAALVNPQTAIPMQRVEFAHTLRGLAALLVLIAHFLGVFWSSPTAVGGLLNAPALSVAMPAYIAPLHFSAQFNYGSFGVAIFFLISGFVIPFSLAGLSIRGFLIARCLRIYPVYIVSILIGMIVIWLVGVCVSEKPFPYSFQHVVAQMFLVRGWLWPLSSLVRKLIMGGA